ncbi:hypothetical protein IEQ34_004937 [Dendrobium chrysotoxum]|uniref:Uncharacterized protein n=1 Tax=Dendrobium chrysotoxum TaxID=161865 RepID=A0AAV7GTP3_DENCH|nr:hypothetical protein IEQ34_004937 [Dendrobium chrysotoxum]
MLSEKEAQQLPSTVIEEFKKSYTFKIIFEDHVQEPHNHIYDVEVKALEAECTEDGFIKGFMKGVHIVHRKTGAEIEGLTPSQASGEPSSNSGGEELESELQQAFSLEEDEDDIDIGVPLFLFEFLFLKILIYSVIYKEIIGVPLFLFLICT